MARKHLLSLLLAAAGVVLLAWIGQQWRDPDLVSLEKPAAKPYQGVEIPEPRQFKPAPIGEYQETVERPLLWASRRPIEPPAAPTPQTAAEDEPASPPKGYRLTGVVISEGEPLALLAKGEEVLRLREGESVEGWQIAGITTRRVTLRNDQRRLAWELFQKQPQAEQQEGEQGPGSPRGSRSP